MGKVLSVASSAVPWALSLFGVPLPAVTGGLSTVNAVVNALPRGRQQLKEFASAAAADFDAQCAHEGRELSDTQREAAAERLVELLEAGDRHRLLGMALIAEPEFRAALLPAEEERRRGADEYGYLEALLGRVHGLVLRFAQSPDVIGVASTAALRLVWAELAARPTVDQVLRLIQQAVAGELRTRQVIVGSRPRLAAGFVAREELRQVRTVLAGESVATLCALQGMRGVGKSQLASAVTEECEHAGWRFVGWVTASSREQTVTELAEIGRLAGVSADDDPEKAAQAVVAWLGGSGPGDRLLVFDNVTDPDQLRGLVPRGPGMHVLVTTTGHGRTLGIPVEVGVYTEPQAIDFLEAMTSLGDPDGARRVAADLGRLPVALTQAATAMNLWHLDYDRYRALLTERALDDVVHREAGDPYPSKVGAALRIAYTAVLDHLQHTDPALGDTARSVLDSLSLLAESGVPRAWLDILAEDPLVVRRAIGHLVQHSLVIESTDRSVVSLHRLQAQVLREDDTATERAQQAIQAAITVLQGVDPGTASEYPQQRELCSLLGAQLSALQGQAHSRHLRDDDQLLSIAGIVTYWANVLSDPYTAIDLVDYLDTLARVLGPDHPDTLGSRNNLAGAYQSAGNLGRAIPLFERTLADRERVLGPDHPDTLGSRSNLASAYQSAGNLGRAIPLFERTLADCERVLGPDHPQTLRSRNNLATAYQAAGDQRRAIPLFERTLADRERVLGPDHPQTLGSRSNLAGAYQAAGFPGRAIPLYLQTLKDTERVLGPDHPQTLRSRNNLAGAYQAAGFPGRAIPLYLQTLTDTERVLGPDHPQTLGLRSNLAVAYHAAGDLRRAIPLFEQTLTDRERVLGPDHPDTLGSRSNLVYALSGQG